MLDFEFAIEDRKFDSLLDIRMPMLHIALQEGFIDETIVIRVDNKEVFRKRGVKTRFQIGYADSFELIVPKGSAKLDVFIENMELSKSILLQVSKDIYLGLSMSPDGDITYKVSDELFGYL